MSSIGLWNGLCAMRGYLISTLDPIPHIPNSYSVAYRVVHCVAAVASVRGGADSPGFNMNFENAPFKLTREYVELMGGIGLRRHYSGATVVAKEWGKRIRDRQGAGSVRVGRA